jgi:hypothetical protein
LISGFPAHQKLGYKLGRLLRHRQLGRKRRVRKDSLGSWSSQCPWEKRNRAPVGLPPGDFFAFRKIDDPIRLALSAVVSKGADTGAGCNLIGGAGNRGAICEVDFQLPCPFETATAIIVP